MDNDAGNCQVFKVFQYSNFDLKKKGGVEAHISETSLSLSKLGIEVETGSSLKNAKKFNPDFILSHADRPMPFEWKRAFPRSLNIHVFHGTSVGRVLACKEYLKKSGWIASLREFKASVYSDAAITVSQMVADEVRRYFFYRKQISVIPNGVEENLFKQAESLNSRPRFLFIGRNADKVKNFTSLIAAADELSLTHPDLELWATNELGVQRKYLRDITTWNREQISAAYRESRALVLCSLYEADGIVAREAQASGIYVLASDMLSLQENLSGYPGTVFVDPSKIDSIASAMRAVCDSKNQTPFPARLRTWKDTANEMKLYFSELKKSKSA